jgi:hypothetical protein
MPTPNLGLTLPTEGGSEDTWGGLLNAALEEVDDVFAAAGDGTAVGINTTGKTLKADGVLFPGTQVPSADPNCLDDYQEGLWTPTIFGTSTAGSVTYALQEGDYTKNGREVIARFKIETTLVASFTGNARIGGLPFSAGSIGAVFISSHGGITFGAGYSSVSGELPVSPGNEIELILNGSGVNSAVLPATGVANATLLRGVAIFRV